MEEFKDAELINLALSGNRAAFDTLIERYYDMMYCLAYKWCGSKEDAEDITHNAFIKVATHLPKFKQDSSFKTWLYRVVVNTANDWHRKKKRRYLFLKTIDSEQIIHTPQDDLKTQELLRLINKLPEGERDAILLVSAIGLSHKEASEILGCKESTVSWRIHEARKKLSGMMSKEA